MLSGKQEKVIVENHLLASSHLNRDVQLDCYLPPSASGRESYHLLLVNDGQDLRTMHFADIIGELYSDSLINPVFAVGIHCAKDRKNEYGTANILDYKGRGARSGLFTRFVMDELIPFLRKQYDIDSFVDKSYAGFSLGGLCALDIVWNHPREFHKVGVFSGSLWWRDKSQEDPEFDEKLHLIMHRQIREGGFHPWLKFFFEVGTLDETADRNQNGIIDSIDDTLSLIEELKLKGYMENDIKYLELADGSHDVATWARAFPDFLKWGFFLSKK